MSAYFAWAKKKCVFFDVWYSLVVHVVEVEGRISGKVVAPDVARDAHEVHVAVRRGRVVGVTGNLSHLRQGKHVSK